MKPETMPYAYGEVVCETDEYDFVKSEQDRLVEYHSYKRGDLVERINTTVFSYVLVISDEYYADVEYRIKSTGEIVTKEETKSINWFIERAKVQK